MANGKDYIPIRHLNFCSDFPPPPGHHLLFGIKTRVYSNNSGYLSDQTSNMPNTVITSDMKILKSTLSTSMVNLQYIYSVLTGKKPRRSITRNLSQLIGNYSNHDLNCTPSSPNFTGTRFPGCSTHVSVRQRLQAQPPSSTICSIMSSRKMNRTFFVFGSHVHVDTTTIPLSRNLTAVELLSPFSSSSNTLRRFLGAGINL